MRRLLLPEHVFVALAALFLTAGAHADLIQSFSAQEVSVNDSSGWLAALRDPAVSRILLQGDLTLDPRDWEQQDSILLGGGRHVTITAPGSPNMTDVHGANTTGAATIQFSDLWPVIIVGSGASLTLENLVLVGLKSMYAPDVAQPEVLRPKGLAMWPTIDAHPGAEVVLNNTMFQYYSSHCSPAAMRNFVMGLWSTVGTDRAGLMPDNITYYTLGDWTLQLPVEPYGGGPSRGDMYLVNYGCAGRCIEEEPYPEETDSSSAGVPWWVWMLVGVGSMLALTATLVIVWWMATRRGKRQAHLQERYCPSGGGLPLAVVKVDNQSTTPASQRLPGSAPQIAGAASALRIRFGDLDQIELGELIGKGGFGRVYRARWRGIQAAVKVVEHSMQSRGRANSRGSFSGAMPWESVLSTALSHPNIVTTYRVSTVRLRPASGSISNASPTTHSNAASGSTAPGPLAGEHPQQQAGKAAGVATDAAGVDKCSAGSSAEGEHGGAVEAHPGASRAALLAEDAPGREAMAAGIGAAHQAVCEKGSSHEAAEGTPSSGAVDGYIELQGSWCEETFYETWMVLEYCDKGSLADAIRAQRFLSRSTGQPHLRAVLLCLLDVARGMLYLHDNNVVHGDLKADNVLLKSREDGGKGFTCKLADFGLSRLLDPAQTQLLTRTCGTLGYMPPEVMAHGQLTTATDVYSFGMLMWELLACQFAFHTETVAQIFYRVVHLGERPVVPNGLECPNEFLNLMQQCWAADNTDRPNFLYILRELELMVSNQASNLSLASASSLESPSKSQHSSRQRSTDDSRST